MNKKFLIVCILLILVISISVIVSMNKNSENNKIIMVTEAGYPPYEYYENNEIIGVDVEIAKEIAKELGKELEIKDVEFTAILNEIKFDKGDFAVAGLTITEERKEEVDFSKEYVTTKLVVMVLDKSDIHTLEDLHGKKMATIPGGTPEKVVLEKYDDVEIIGTNASSGSVESLKAGKADFVVMEEDTALDFKKENPELRILDKHIGESYLGIAVKKGNTELLEKINIVLERLMSEGKIEEFIEKHTNK